MKEDQSISPDVQSQSPSFETLEAYLREQVQGFVQKLLEEEVTEYLVHKPHERSETAEDGSPAYRNGHGKPGHLAFYECEWVEDEMGRAITPRTAELMGHSSGGTSPSSASCPRRRNARMMRSCRMPVRARRSVSCKRSNGGSATGISPHATLHLGELSSASLHLRPQLRERGGLLLQPLDRRRRHARFTAMDQP